MQAEQLDDITISLQSGYATLRDAARALGDAGINVEAVCVLDGGERGGCHLLVAQGSRAAALLRQQDIPVLDMRRVNAMRLPNRPGTLATVLDLLLPHPGAIDFIYQATDRGLIIGSSDRDLILRELSTIAAPSANGLPPRR